VLIGYCHRLALGAPGKGRGRRSLLHRLTAKGVIHDASYHLPLLLQGAREGLLAVLRAVRCAGLPSFTADILRFDDGLNASSKCSVVLLVVLFFYSFKETPLKHINTFERGARVHSL
jgi:hypothetical protein